MEATALSQQDPTQKQCHTLTMMSTSATCGMFFQGPLAGLEATRLAAVAKMLKVHLTQQQHAPDIEIR